MNKTFFYKLNTIDGDKYLEEEYIDVLYDYYVTGGKIYNYKVRITKEEFNTIINTINDKLKEVLSDEEIKVAFIQYIQLLIADSREGYIVDKKYFIKKLDYICIDLFDNKFLKKSKKKIKSLKKECKNLI